MKTQIKIMMIMLLLFLSGCSGSVQPIKGSEVSEKRDIVESLSDITQPPFEQYSSSDATLRDYRTFFRYRFLIFNAITNYYKVYGKLPTDLAEFFQSDLCLVSPVESTTGLPFVSSSTLDENHPEYLVYNRIDPDTAELNMIQFLKDSEPRIYTHNWTSQRFVEIVPEGFRDKFDNKLPIHNKSMVMTDHLASLVQHAMALYFDEHGTFPENIDSLFEDWGTFRREPWNNYEYDDPERKIRNKVFGFDRDKNVYCVHHFWGDADKVTAFQFPANFIAEPNRPLNMRKIDDIDSLDIEFFADIETLKNLPNKKADILSFAPSTQD